jgi:hypothetical protein
VALGVVPGRGFLSSPFLVALVPLSLCNRSLRKINLARNLIYLANQPRHAATRKDQKDRLRSGDREMRRRSSSGRATSVS